MNFISIRSRRRALFLFSTGFIVLAVFGLTILWLKDGSSAAETEPVAIKIYTREPGIYEIAFEELKSLGLVRNPGDLGQLELTQRGEIRQFWRGFNHSIRFYAEKSQSAYSQDNIFWLSKDIGEIQVVASQPANLPEEKVAPGAFIVEIMEGYYLERLYLEENNIYLPRVAVGGDHWLWKALSGGRSMNLSFNPRDLGEGSGMITLTIWSGTEAGVSPDHHLRVAINGIHVADEDWEGKGQHILRGEIGPGVLIDGANEIVIEAPGDLDILADLYHLDWIEIQYPRQPVAESDRLEFTYPEKGLELRGFSGLVSIYEISATGQAILVAMDVLPEEFAFRVGHHYIVVGSGGYLHPERMLPVKASKFIQEAGEGGEYLAIGPEELLKPLEPLLKYRAGKGMRTVTVPVEMLYDRYNSGFPEPEAIIQFIRYAYQTWEIRPAYLLLVGDSSYDPKSFQADESANRLPAFFVDTVFGGETVTDIEFGQLNDDPWPDLAVGLMPARTPDQVRILVEKTLAYEINRERQASPLRLVVVADGQEKSFKQDAQSFLDLFPDGVSSEIYAPQPGDASASRQIRQYFEANYDLLAYFGHGSVSMWGKDRLFTTEEAEKLGNNQRPLIVVNITCLTGLYTHPAMESLAEALLWRQGGGAVAVLAPSSLTLPFDQSFLSAALAEILMSEENLTIGQVHLMARRRISLDAVGAGDVMRTFMLFGDPALELHFSK